MTKVYVVLDTKGRVCFIASSLEQAQQSRVKVDVPEFDIVEWDVDQTVFFGRRVL